VGAEVHGRFQHQDLFFGRLDSQVAEHLLIRRLVLARGHGDPDAAHRQEGHGPEAHVGAFVERAGGGEGAVAQPLHPVVGLEGRVTGQARLGAEADAQAGPLADLVSRSGRFRVIKQAHDRSLCALAYQFGQQADRVGIGAAAGIVLGVGQDDRAPRRMGRRAGGRHGMGDRFGRLPEPGGEGVFAGQGQIVQLLGRRFGRRRVLAVSHHRGAAVVNVGGPEAASEGQGDQRRPVQAF
jgi:hypothetical protein